jgi:phosphatidylinositol alpha-1,6-mannosyltransferase
VTDRRILVVTNDFPPRPGGIQSFVHGLVSRLPPEDVVVFTSRWRGCEEWDAEQPYDVVRADTSVLLPVAAARRQAVELLRDRGCSAVWFGAAAPLGLLAPALRAAGATMLVATTHGHEVGWAMLPGARGLLRRIAGDVDVVTYLGDFTYARLRAALGPHADRLQRLAPGVDATEFRPGRGARVRALLGLADRPVVVCVSRLMPRKGQDVLVRALPAIREAIPDAALLLVGGGPSRGDLERQVDRLGLREHVVLTGSVPAADLPSYYGAGDVFAMPARTRLGGLDVEGLGIVYLEAAACGLPVVSGRSGGAPEAVRDGDTGVVVDGASLIEVAAAIAALLADPARAAAMGERGRTWVEAEWSWDKPVALLRDWLAGPVRR